MLQEEVMFDLRAPSPSLSDAASLVSSGFEDLENLELFPDLQFSNGGSVVSRQVSRESTKEPVELKKPKLIALKLDSRKEQELLDYITGVSDVETVKSNVNGVSPDGGQTPVRRVTVNRAVMPQNDTELNVINVERFTSLSAYPEEFEGGKCMSKNAIAARENRQRKKQYVTELEQTMSSLKAENTTLKSQVSTMQETVTDLRTEVKYLRNVLANQSTLAALLKNIPAVPGVNLVSAMHVPGQAAGEKKKRMVSRKRRREDDPSDEENIDIQASDEAVDSDDDNIESSQEVLIVKSAGLVVNGGGGVNTRSQQQSHLPKLDHCYSTNNPAVTQYQKRQQMKKRKTSRSSSGNATDDDTTGAGICLHVSGKKVSLEFCAQCSRRASEEERVS